MQRRDLRGESGNARINRAFRHAMLHPMPVLPLTRMVAALLLPLLAVVALQLWQGQRRSDARVLDLRDAMVAVDGSALPVAGTQPGRLPLTGTAAGKAAGALWISLPFELPTDVHEPWLLGLSFRPALQVYLDGELLAGDPPGREHRLVVGQERWQVGVPPLLLKAGPHQLQLRLAAPGPAATLSQVWLGPPEAVRSLMAVPERWQMLRTGTAASALLVALFLALVARVRRDEPLYAASSLHLALLALLLAPYVLPEQPLPSPWWRVLLDIADLGAKALLLFIVLRLVRPRQTLPGPWPRRLLALLAVCALIDLVAAVENWRLGDFRQLWPWWSLGLRALMLAAAMALAVRPLLRRSRLQTWGTALLVGFSGWTWAYVTWFALVQPGMAPLVDSNAAAHLGWVIWVAVLLQRHFVHGAHHEAALRRRLQDELLERQRELETAFEARRQAERERAAFAQRQRLLQDLHDGLGSRLLALRVQVDTLEPAALATALDECLVEMRLSVDSLGESSGDLGVLLGRWRQRMEPVLKAAGLRLHWRVFEAPELPCLRDAGALELVRWLQEASSNVLRHAGARELSLGTEACEGAICLWLVDDGRGLSADAPPGQGLNSLRARAERLGAQLDLISPAPRDWVEDGVGTALCLRLPSASAGPR